MDTLAMARTGLSLKSTFKSSSNSAYSQMPDLPDTTHAYETLSRGWTSLVDTVSSTGSSIMQSRSLSNAGSHREIPPVTGGSSSNDTPLVSTTAASGLWQRCYDSIAGSYQMAGSAETDKTIDGETHLTRVMKQYYLNKCESARDLPDWLFPEKMHGASNGRAWSESGPATSQYNSTYAAAPRRGVQQQQSSSLRDIFDAQSGPSSKRHDSADSGYASMDSNLGRKTTDKLRSLKSDRQERFGRRDEAPSSNQHDYQSMPGPAARGTLRPHRQAAYQMI